MQYQREIDFPHPRRGPVAGHGPGRLVLACACLAVRCCSCVAHAWRRSASACPAAAVSSWPERRHRPVLGAEFRRLLPGGLYVADDDLHSLPGRRGRGGHQIPAGHLLHLGIRPPDITPGRARPPHHGQVHLVRPDPDPQPVLGGVRRRGDQEPRRRLCRRRGPLARRGGRCGGEQGRETALHVVAEFQQRLLQGRHRLGPGPLRASPFDCGGDLAVQPRQVPGRRLRHPSAQRRPLGGGRLLGQHEQALPLFLKLVFPLDPLDGPGRASAHVLDDRSVAQRAAAEFRA